MNFQFLAEADALALRMEKAKRALEAAKLELEASKKNYEELLARSDEQGIARAKLKKLTEDRLALLFESGVLDQEFGAAPVAKEPKVKKPKTAKVAPVVEDEIAAMDDEDEPLVSEAEVRGRA